MRRRFFPRAAETGIGMEKAQAGKRIAELRKTLAYHARLYYQLDAPEISDYEYDALFRELSELEAAYPEFDDPNSPTKRRCTLANRRPSRRGSSRTPPHCR